MKSTDLKKSLEVLISNKVPTFLWGAPGVGKSSIVKQIAQDKNIGFIDLRLTLMDPTDLKGIPFFDKDRNKALWASPSFLPTSGEGILFLDELNSALPSVQSSAYQLILDRQIGEYMLPDGWAIVSAGNREEDNGITYRMPAPLANRFVHLDLEVDVVEWKKWAYNNSIDSKIVAYITYKPQHLFTFNSNKNIKTFATPRSWEYVNSIINSDIDFSLMLDIISGSVGRDVGISFISFLRVLDRLPNIQNIVDDGEFVYSDEVDVLYALSSGIVSYYLQNQDTTKLENILLYTLDLKAEFAVLIVQDLQKNGIRMEHLAPFKEWVKKFSYLLA